MGNNTLSMLITSDPPASMMQELSGWEKLAYLGIIAVLFTILYFIFTSPDEDESEVEDDN